MTGDEKVKKNRDPIFMVCLAVFLVAAVAVVGVYINDHYIEEDDTEAAYGDKVTVNYTGSYYDYVKGEFAVVFDTSYSSVAENDKIIKSNSFTAADKKKFDPLTFTIGKGEVLQLFGDSVVGHKVGDKFKVYVPSGEGYVGPEAQTMKLSDGSVDVTEIVTKANFDRMYPDIKLNAGMATFTTVYGWEATAMLSGNSVAITHNPTVGKTYDYADNEDSKFGKVQFKVTGIDSKVNFNFIIDGKKTGGENGEIQMIDIDLGEVWHITNVDGDSFTYHTGKDTANMPLYFEIELVKIGA